MAASLLAIMKISPRNVDELEPVFQEELKNALGGGFSPEEIAVAKSGFLKSRQNRRAWDMPLR